MRELEQIVGVVIFSGIWQGFALAAVVGLCLRMVPRVTAALRFWVWGAVFAVVSVLPWVEGVRSGVSAGSVGRSLHVDARWGLAMGAVWALASAYRAVELGVHGVRLWGLRRRAVVVDTGAVLDRRAMRRVAICTSDDVDRPSVIGFFAPRVLIPAWLYAQLSAGELEQVVLHEMEHLRRGDDWWNLVQKLGLVAFPLNPVLLWVERRLCYERELACDDGVLRRTGAPKAYATCLTSLAERGMERRVLSLALGALGRRSELGLRVQRILRREAVMGPVPSRWVMGGMAMVLAAGTVGLARCPQLVAFSGGAAGTAPGTGLGTASGAVMAAPAVGMERVRFAEGAAAPRMTLLKASMPVRAESGVANPAPKARPKRVKAKTRKVAKRELAQGWVVVASTSTPTLVEGDAEGEQAGAVVMPVSDALGAQTVFLPYTAVAVRGGWLIVPL